MRLVMLGKIFSSIIAAPLIDKLIAPFTDLFKAYLNKQITEEELRTKLRQTLLESVTEIKKSHSDAIAKTYESFLKAATQSKLLMILLVSVGFSQLFVLLWHQFGISALCYLVGKHTCWPSSGATADWAYLLLGFILGAGPVILRSGPAKLDIDKLKSAIGR